MNGPDSACNPDPDEVHVWHARLSRSAADVSQLRGELPHDEQEKAERFRFEPDRMRFLIGRIVARSVLAHCLQQRPADIRLSLDQWGKPAADSSSIQFSISHSGDLVLFALAHDRRVGVDVEQIVALEDMHDIASGNFSRLEYSRLQAVPQTGRTESFYRCWTMKEAYIKGRGEGFGLPLDSFDVAFLAGETPRLLATRLDPADAGRWCFHWLDVGPDHVAALATETDRQLELKQRDWNAWRGAG